MKEYVLLFRMDITTAEAQPSPELMELYMSQWMEWINDIAGRQQLADGGNHFLQTGTVIKPGNIVVDSPYTVNKESVAGYIIILAEDMADAIGIAGGCPILQGEGTNVEIRQTATPQSMKPVKRSTN